MTAATRKPTAAESAWRAARSAQDGREAEERPTLLGGRRAPQATPGAPARGLPAEAGKTKRRKPVGGKYHAAGRPAESTEEGRGKMSAEQFRQALADIGISQVGFAKLIGVDGRTVRSWAKIDGGKPVPRYAHIIIVLMLQTGISAERLERLV